MPQGGRTAGFLIYDFGSGYYFAWSVRANFIRRTSRYPSPYFNFAAGYIEQKLNAGFWHSAGSRGYTRVAVGLDLKAAPGILPYFALGHQINMGGGAEKRNYFWLGIGVRFGL